jgi:hypothetical protein
MLSGWSALYYGNGYYPARSLDKPTLYQGYDIVPGFVIGVGKILGETKFSVGGDYYYFWRNWEKTNDQPSIKQNRLRANFILSTPFWGKFNLTVTQRFERITQKRFQRELDTVTYTRHGDFKWLDYTQIFSWMRHRTTYKVSFPSFTSLNIAPYASYEGFLTTIASPDDSYYMEAEFGFSMSPFKGISISLADQIQKLPQSDIPEAHQITLNLFYTLDLRKTLAQMTN